MDRTGMLVPSYTSYVVKVSGRTTVSPNPQALECNPTSSPPYGAEGSYGPAGDRYYYLQVAAGLITSAGVGSIGLRYDGVGTSSGDDAQSDTVFAWDGGEIAMRRSGIQGSSNGTNPPGCLAHFYRLASGQSISVVIFDGQELSITPSWAAVRKGTVVSFRATSRGVLVNAPHWRFDADPGAVNETTACGLSGPNPCSVTVQNSGTLRVASYAQGRMRAASARVKVYSNFDLTAEPSDVVRGDTVTFTPRLDGVGDRAARWLWRGDDSSVVVAPCAAEDSPCHYAPRVSGTMWAYTALTGGDSASAHVTVRLPSLELTASKSTLEAPGENDTFIATANGRLVVLGWSFNTEEGGTLASPGSAWGGCSPSSTQCTNFVSETGTVDVLGVVNGDTLRASVHVQVVPCPIDSAPPLNEPTVRRDLLVLLSHSGWLLHPGDGIAPGDSVGNKRERAGDIYRRPDGSFYFQEDALNWSTECFGKRSTTNTKHSPDDVKVGDVHTEPTENGWLVYGCQPDPVTGMLRKRGPWEATDTTREQVRRLPPSLTGGGSPQDWFRIRNLPENKNGPAVDGYVINADGEIWRLPAEKARIPGTDFTSWLSNRQVWRWTSNQNPACNW